MSNLESNKILAGIGAILFGLGSFSSLSGYGIIVPIIGLVLLLMGVKGLAENYSEPGIYGNTLKVVIYSIIALVLIAAGIGGGALLLTTGVGFIFGIVLMIVGVVVAFIFYIMSAKHFKTASNLLAQKTGNGMFTTAGNLYYWGAWLSIILIGFILIFIAWLLMTVAFFSISSTSQPAQSTGYTPPPAGAPTGTTRYCSNCGAPNTDPNAQFCQHCGKQLT
jgi:uncharacterized membrane protein